MEHNAAAADLELSEEERSELLAAAEAFEPLSRRQGIEQVVRQRFGHENKGRT
jgi:hypothetical protein